MSAPDRPATYRDIAARAGVSVAAVSLAMRDSGKISAALREKIQRIAIEMDYRPNPLLSVYQSSVRARKPVSFRSVMGWINDWGDQKQWQLPYMKPLLTGARERAHVLGYEIDEIWVPEMPNEDPEEKFHRWDRILKARGIQGVILPAMVHGHFAVMEWKDYSVVCIGKFDSHNENEGGHPAQVFHHHRVNSDYLFNIREVIRQLRARGCRRIGLATSRWIDDDADQAYTSGYMRATLDWPVEERVPILLEGGVDVLRDWVLKHRPDAVIATHNEAKEGIAKAGMLIPQEIRLVHMNLAADVANWSGIDRQLPFLGAGTVDTLSSILVRNERGAPLFAKDVNIKGVWVDGKT